MLHLFVAFNLFFLSGIGARLEDGNKDELKKLQGTWSLHSAEGEGKRHVPEENDRLRMIVTGEKFTMKSSRNQTVGGTLQLDVAKQPRVIQFTFTEGSVAGHTGQAIYRLEGDTLTLCQIGDGRELPHDFKPGPRQTVAILKREK